MARLGDKSITWRYRAYRLRENEAEGVLAAEGRVTTAVVDLERFRAVPVPNELLELFSPLVEPDPEREKNA